MAKDTIELLTILKNLARVDLGINYDEADSLEDFIEETNHLLFNDYPLFDEAYREVLNRKIVSHFIFDEISVVPFQRWRFIFNRHLNEIMVNANRLYKANQETFNPFHDTNITETYEREGDVGTQTSTERAKENATTKQGTNNSQANNQTNSTGNESLSTNSQSDQFKADTPFNRNEINQYASEVTGETSEGSSNTDNTFSQTETGEKTDTQNSNIHEEETSNSQSNLSTKTTEDYVKKISGKRYGQSYGKMLKDYHDSLIDVDQYVLDKLAICFRFMYN